jgi:hypothetical protein
LCPCIVQITPLADGQSSTYKLYEDSGHAEDYQHGVAAWTPITATQKGDDLEVEIAPIEGHYPGMLLKRGYELRLPADWPPQSVTVNGTQATSRGVPDPLILAMQSGDRIGYKPETASAEIAKRQQAFAAAIASVQAIVGVADSDEQVAKLLSRQNVKVQPSAEQIARYRMLMHRALTQAQDVQ